MKPVNNSSLSLYYLYLSHRTASWMDSVKSLQNTTINKIFTKNCTVADGMVTRQKTHSVSKSLV